MSKPKAKNNRKLEKIQAVAPSSQTNGSLPSIPAEWDSFSRVLAVDLEQLAFETKALRRKRKVRCAQGA